MPVKQVNHYADIVITCSADDYYRSEKMLEDNVLMRVISGELKIIQADRTYVFSAGDTLLFPRNQLSTLILNAKDDLPCRTVIMRLTTSIIQDYYRTNEVRQNAAHTAGILPFAKNLLLDGFFASILPYFDLEYQLPEKVAAVKIVEAIEILRSLDENVDSILADFSETGKINLSDFMEKNYMFNIPIEQFGQLTGRSLTTFKRDFKKAFQTTPQKWLTQKRLELAHYQLSESKRKPIDIYAETGFENLSHFSFAFKKQYGYTPTQLAQSLS